VPEFLGQGFDGELPGAALLVQHRQPGLRSLADVPFVDEHRSPSPNALVLANCGLVDPTDL